MVKKGSRHMTSVFGDDAECYLSKLFLMMRNPNGQRRPDLISIDERYDPRLTIEAKSGIDGKVSLMSGQLHYSVTTIQDYENLFGEEFALDDSVLPGMNNDTVYPVFQRGPVAYYYGIVSRLRELKSGDVEPPYHSIKLEWEDQVIVPHDLVFYSFAIAKFIRTRGTEGNLGNLIEGFKDQMGQDVRDKSSHYRTRRETQDWQNFYLRDMRAIFEDDFGVATKGGQTRLGLLKRYYPGFHDLQRIEIPGPNNTRIMVLANPGDYDLFDIQLRSTVEERTPVLERVSRVRERAKSLLKKMEVEPSKNHNSGLFENGSPKTYSVDNLTTTEVRKLKRLEKWADWGEPLEVMPENEAISDVDSDLDSKVFEKSEEVAPF